MKTRLLALLGGAVLLAACADGAPLAPTPGPVPPSPTAQRFDCLASVREGSVRCHRPGPSGARLAIMGAPYVTISTTNVAFDAGTGIFQADFAAQNNLPFAIGTTDGTTADPAGVRVFFNSGPTVTSGWGTITVQNADGVGTFTASNQPYFQYNGVLAAGAATAARTWQFHVDPDVAFFGFTLLVDTRVPPVLEIHEIMAHPTTASEPAGEWFEIFNRGKEQIDLQGWTLASGGDAGHVVASSLVIPVNGRVVVGGSTSAAANGGAPVAYAYTGIDLANGTADWLALRAPTGATVDSVDWGAAPGDVASAPPTGVSLQLAAPDSANLYLSGATSHWHPSVTPFGTAGELGTPGGRNLFPLTGAMAISSEEIHTCMVDSAGQGWCWGIHDLSGELGDGTAGPHPPVAVRVRQPAGVLFSSVALQPQKSCALSTSGAAWCWGKEVSVGFYDAQTRYSPTPVPQGALAFTALSGGNIGTCGLTAAGQTWCWNSNGPMVVPYALTQPPGVQFTEISVANNNVGICGLTAAGQAWCQGRGAMVGAGLGPTTTSDTFSAVHQGVGVRFQSISTNAGTTCAVSTIGQGFCWGTNDTGQVGDGTTTPRSEPVMVSHPASVRFTRIEVGKSGFACGVSTTGQAHCWGKGPLGTGATSSPTPVAVTQPGGVQFSRLSAGGGYACAIATGGGTVYCWGENGNGALGDGSTTDRPTPAIAVRP